MEKIKVIIANIISDQDKNEKYRTKFEKIILYKQSILGMCIHILNLLSKANTEKIYELKDLINIYDAKNITAEIVFTNI